MGIIDDEDFEENCRLEISTKGVVAANDIGKDWKPKTEEKVDKMIVEN